MKKISVLCLIVLTISFFTFVPNMQAKTLRELKEELEKTERELEENDGQRAITEDF